jgi:hypothetical protein
MPAAAAAGCLSLLLVWIRLPRGAGGPCHVLLPPVSLLPLDPAVDWPLGCAETLRWRWQGQVDQAALTSSWAPQL